MLIPSQILGLITNVVPSLSVDLLYLDLQILCSDLCKRYRDAEDDNKLSISCLHYTPTYNESNGMFVIMIPT